MYRVLMCLLVTTWLGATGEEPPDLLNGLEGVSDDRLWDLLKEASRGNGSEPAGEVAYDYGDYPAYEDVNDVTGCELLTDDGPVSEASPDYDGSTTDEQEDLTEATPSDQEPSTTTDTGTSIPGETSSKSTTSPTPPGTSDFGGTSTIASIVTSEPTSTIPTSSTGTGFSTTSAATANTMSTRVPTTLTSMVTSTTGTPTTTSTITSTKEAAASLTSTIGSLTATSTLISASERPTTLATTLTSTTGHSTTLTAPVTTTTVPLTSTSPITSTTEASKTSSTTVSSIKEGSTILMSTTEAPTTSTATVKVPNPSAPTVSSTTEPPTLSTSTVPSPTVSPTTLTSTTGAPTTTTETLTSTTNSTAISSTETSTTEPPKPSTPTVTSTTEAPTTTEVLTSITDSTAISSTVTSTTEPPKPSTPTVTSTTEAPTTTEALTSTTDSTAISSTVTSTTEPPKPSTPTVTSTTEAPTTKEALTSTTDSTAISSTVTSTTEPPKPSTPTVTSTAEAPQKLTPPIISTTEVPKTSTSTTEGSTTSATTTKSSTTMRSTTEAPTITQAGVSTGTPMTIRPTVVQNTTKSSSTTAITTLFLTTSTTEFPAKTTPINAVTEFANTQSTRKDVTTLKSTTKKAKGRPTRKKTTPRKTIKKITTARPFTTTTTSSSTKSTILSLATTTSTRRPPPRRPEIVVTKPKSIRFDPSRISIIGNDNAEITERTPSRRVTPATAQRSTSSLLDVNKIFMIEEATMPTVELERPCSWPACSQEPLANRPVVPDPPRSYDMPEVRPTRPWRAQARPVSRPQTSGGQGSVPELVCFQVVSGAGRPLLSCVPINGTSSGLPNRPILVNIKQRQEEEVVAVQRRIYLTAGDRQRPAVVLRLGPERQTGLVFRPQDAQPPARMRLAVRLPAVRLGVPVRLSRIEADGSSGFDSAASRVRIQFGGRTKRAAPYGHCDPDRTLENDGKRSLAFVFDNTGSMSTELEQMKATARDITTEMTGLLKTLVKDYVLVTFNDPTVGMAYCTEDYTEFQSRLAEISVTGGGDCPELSLTGLERALAVIRQRSFIFVITDAGPKDVHKEGTVIAQIMRKKPTIMYLLTGECSSGGTNIYKNVVKAAQGHVIDVGSKSDVQEIMKLIKDVYIRDNLVNLGALYQPTGGKETVDVPVDSSLRNITITLAGENPKVNVTDPIGGHPSGERKSYPSLIIIHYKMPMPGIWRAEVSSSSAHSVSLVGTSTTDFKVGFSVQPTDKVSATSHRPLKGAENHVLVEVSNPEGVGSISSIEIKDYSGRSIVVIPLRKITSSNNTIYTGGPFVPPDGVFTMEMHGVDTRGIPIKRISDSAISSQLPELPYITMLSKMTVDAGTRATVKCHVESLVPVRVKLFRTSSENPLFTYSFKQTDNANLEIEAVYPEDGGTYRCWARNLAGEQHKDIQLIVNVNPPTVMVKDEVVYKAGEDVEIPCNISSPVAYNALWRKGSNGNILKVEEDKRTKLTGKGLVLRQAVESDEGWYYCIAQNLGGENKGTTYLKFSSLPSVELTGSGKFEAGFNITLICSVGGSPSPQIHWLKNGKLIHFMETNKVVMEYETKYSELHIFNAAQDDEGTYSCLAQNHAGRASKETVLTYEEKPRINYLQTQHNIEAGGDVLLPCEATGIPTPSITWKKNNEIITQDWNHNLKVLSDNSLLIRPAALDDSGTYSCLAQNEVGRDEMFVTLSVTGSPPYFLQSPQDSWIEIGESGRLRCEATGQPTPRITWRRSQYKPIRAVLLENTLEFKNISMSDAGEYWCIAENELGTAKINANVNVTGGVVPMIKKVKEIEIVKTLSGEGAELSCEVIGGKPFPSLVWYKDGFKLNPHSTNGIKLDNGSLFLSSVNPPDTGVFECVAINEIGSDIKKIELKNYEQPKIESSRNANVVAVVGRNARLECSVTGDPTPNVTWKRYPPRAITGVKLEESNDLYFDKVSEEDTGRYICTAENIAGVARRPYALNVMVPPKIQPWSLEKFVEIGNIVTLECRVRAIPRASIVWLKDEEAIPKSKYYGQFLRFYANTNDSGTYSCTAENKAGKDRVETNLIVLVPPQIEEGVRSVRVVSGKEAVLSCRVTGNPLPSLSWQSNGEIIKKELASESGVLRLANVTEADAGTYVCTAQNKAGTSKKKIELIVLTPPKILPWNMPLKTTVGDLVNVTCQHFAEPEATIAWYKDKEPLPAEYVKDSSRLEFIVRASSKGVYTCEATNEAGSDSKDFLLVILDPPVFGQELPSLVETVMSENIEVPCTAFGDPHPHISWQTAGQPITTNTKRIVNSETGLLTILNAAPEDEGYYICTAKNKAGEIWRTVEINVLERPKAELTVSSQMVKDGDDVEFHCNVTGKPAPNITWYKDGKLLSTENNKQLRLIAYFKEQGNYSCVAKNSAGEDESTVQLSVSTLPIIAGGEEERVAVLKGDNVSLACSVEGVPDPQITWYFNQTKLAQFGVFYQIINKTALWMGSVSGERDGVYTCEAHNFAGKAKKKFRLHVNVKPSIIDHYETQIRLDEGKDLSLPCNAEGVPRPKISWEKDSKPLPTKAHSGESPSVHENILLILSAENSSSGVYTCLATNEEGVALRNYTLTVQGVKKELPPGVEQIEIIESADGILSCNSTPGSTVVWLKENKTLDQMGRERADDVHLLLSDGGERLKITEATTTDSGNYSCHASHPHYGNTTKLFSVDVLVPPYFPDMFPLTDFTVLENKSLTLDCSLQGNPPPLINWRLAESNLPVNRLTMPGVYPIGRGDQSLHFSAAQPKHTALYICTGFNKLGKESRIFNVKVTGPPKRIGAELVRLDVVNGGELQLNCSVEGVPFPTFHWSLRTSSGKEKSLKYESKKIRIGFAQGEDEGVYTCTAINVHGNITKLFNVSVFETPRIKRETVNSLTLAEGERAELSCETERGRPTQVSWYYEDRQLSSTDLVYVLTSLTKASQGLYTCAVSNIAGSDQRQFVVQVIQRPESVRDGPSEERVETLEGERIERSCPVRPAEGLTITWKKDGRHLPEYDNSSLVIPTADISHEGRYVCVASNIAGAIAHHFDIHVWAEPELVARRSEDTNISIPLEGKLILNCSVKGNPKPSIIWVKNLQQIDDVELPQVIFSSDNQILEIDEVALSDGGKYSCFPSNVAGSTEKHFEVQITEPPSAVEKSSRTGAMEKIVFANVYRRVVLRCPLSGNPQPTISWFKGDEKTERDERLRVSQDNKTLTISHADESLAGVFKCRAKNELGESTFVFHLHIKIGLEWDSWSEWTECSASCGGGSQERRRYCLGERNEVLSEYIHLHNDSCTGPAQETRPCNTHICPVDGGWGEWSDWSECSVSCGDGWRRRSRRCSDPPPQHGGLDCEGQTYDDQPCQASPCPVDGRWSEWSDWNKCSATCGSSIKMRQRVCNNPPAQYGGEPCRGNSRDIALCRKRPCPVEFGGWSGWSRWSECSASCGTGRQARVRTCLVQPSQQLCLGRSSQTKLCKAAKACETRRYPRHAQFDIHGEINGQQIDQHLEAKLVHVGNESSLTFTKPLSPNESFAYLPFVVSPVSWVTADEEWARNGLSLTNGTFHQNSTYTFPTGDEMEVQSDAESEDSLETLKLNIRVKGHVPSSSPAAATLVIKPYSEDMIQVEPGEMRSSATMNIDEDGRLFPVSVKKNLRFQENRHWRISPIERLSVQGATARLDKERNQLEFRASPAKISSKVLRDACPQGFKYNVETGECADLNECRRKGLNDCQPSQICINTIGSYSCECRGGFRPSLQGTSCRDINECEEGLHMCSHRCVNTRGSYQCLCPRTLILAEDMHNCVQDSEDYYTEEIEDEERIEYQRGVEVSVDRRRQGKAVEMLERDVELGFDLTPPDLLHDSADSIPSSSTAYTTENITCRPGFVRKQDDCQDINECFENEYACQKEQLCMNTPGSYVCIEAPCPDNFTLSTETRSCLLICSEEEKMCTDGAELSESLQIITVPVYKGNYTFYPRRDILEMASYDNNDLPLKGSIYEIAQNDAGLPVNIRTEERLGVLYATKYFEVTKEERLVLMSSKYDSDRNKLHSTMFVVLIYNINSEHV